MKKELHLFDFDGTITLKDSLFHFLQFLSFRLHPKKSFGWMFVKSLPFFFFAKMGLYSKSKAKEIFISSFIRGKDEEDLIPISKEYAREAFRIIRPEAIKRIEILKKEKVHLVLVSASLDLWLIPIAEKLGFQLICTRAEKVNGVFTGRFNGENCNGAEKAKRIKRSLDLSKFSKIVAYGDTSGDKEMLDLADQIHFKPFR